MNAMTSDTILLTGATGQVGGQLLRTLGPLGKVIAPSRQQMDLSRPESVREAIRSVRPRWIVNAGAYTAVDKAESKSELAYAVNAVAVSVVGQEAQTIGAGVIHLSTDYVFSGKGLIPYLETDPTDPLSVYGVSKLAGELALAASKAHLIFRTSWVYGATGSNFLLTVLRLAQERKMLRVVADQHGAPTWSGDLATMIAAVIVRCEASASQKGCSLSEAVAQVAGLYHAAGAGQTTWHGFACEAIRQMREKEPTLRFAEIEAIATSEYPTPAMRPANSRLNCSKLASTFAWRMPEWRQSLCTVINQLS